MPIPREAVDLDRYDRSNRLFANPTTSLKSHVENVRKGFFEPEQYRAVIRYLPEYLRPVAAIAS
jgi:hypothetical protein